MIEFGYHQVQVWLDKNEVKQVRLAAKLARKRLATWIREVATARARADLDAEQDQRSAVP